MQALLLTGRVPGNCCSLPPGPSAAHVQPFQHTLHAKQARRQNAVRTAAARAMASADASGYGSDEEVYATAKAVDDADGYDEQEFNNVDKKKIEPLVALDHANMEYDDFVKDFYEEPAALKALSFPEVGSLILQRKRTSDGCYVRGASHEGCDPVSHVEVTCHHRWPA